MYSDPVSPSGMVQGKSDPSFTGGKGVGMPNEPRSSSQSLFRTLLSSCGGFVEAAALLIGPSDCVSCIDEPLRRSTRSQRSMRRNSTSKTKLKLAQKLKENPSREGEVVDVPIKLVKSRSGKAVTNEKGEVYDPYRSFDDSISALSAHTLDEMERKLPTSLRASQSEKPRNGDELLPPSPARVSSSESSDNSVARDNPHDEIDNDIPFRRNFDESLQIRKVEQTSPTYELIENDIPFVKIKPKRRKQSEKKGTTRISKASDRPVDAHLAPTPKARGRKSKRRSRFEPQVAEI